MKFLSLIVSGGIGTQIALWLMGIIMIASGAFGIIYKLDSIRLERKLSIATTNIKNLTVDNEILKSNNGTLKENLKRTADANATTYETAQKLLQERDDTQKIIDSLSVKARSEKALLSRLMGQIDQLSKDPKNEGVLAPVLKETIREIQKARGEKE